MGCRFRWVVCQLDALRRCFKASIRRVLNELPMTLDETYERILLGIDREKREHAIRLFQCLAFSRRPLRANELAEVFAIEFGTRTPMLNTSLRPEDADEAVMSACSTLVTTIELDEYDNEEANFDFDSDFDSATYDDRKSRVVQFSHYSVKEFLTSERLAKSEKRDLFQYHISPAPAHTVLAQTCISTFLQPDLHFRNIRTGFPLAEYGAQNWFHHAQCDGVASQIQDEMERLFDPDRRHFTTWVSIHDIDYPNSWGRPMGVNASPLYYAASCGFGSIVEHLLLKCRQDPNSSRGRQGTPLHVVVVSGHTSITRLLLENTADVNARDVNRVTPLHEAVESGNLEIARLLLSHGAVVNALDNQGDSPLHKAVLSGKPSVVELLLQSGADVNTRDIYDSTPFRDAVDSGNLDIAQLLISHGVDVNTVNHQGDTLLHNALRFRKFDVVELLVKGGADVNIRNKYNITPFHGALGSENLDIARLFIRHGADVNAPTPWDTLRSTRHRGFGTPTWRKF